MIFGLRRLLLWPKTRAMGPDFQIEQGLGGLVAGVDEVGRGPWAGPVMVCAVILDPAQIPVGLNDSKKLTEARREALALQIEEVAQISLGSASVEEIDRINIRQATFLAMTRALAAPRCRAAD